MLQMKSGRAARREKREAGRTTINGRNQADDGGPHGGNKISKECVIHGWIAANVLKYVEPVALNDVFCQPGE